LLAVRCSWASDIADTIARVKPSIVAVGTFERTRSPPFQFRGTGFAIGDGTVIATNAHVLPASVDSPRLETLAFIHPERSDSRAEIRLARTVRVDVDHDLALITFDGAPLPALTLRSSQSTREGQDVLMTGFPIGSVLGLYPATHRGMISAITPIAIPQGRAMQLDNAIIKRLAEGNFVVLQLDAVAFPGNSGSPVYDPRTGEVMGIVNMTFVKGTKEAALTQPSGISYAVPAEYLIALLRSSRSEASSK
jgi:S1-C subfamily serine protease